MVIRTQSLVLYVCGVACAIALIAPVTLHAVGTAADKQCTPFYRECTTCGMKPNPDKREGQPKCIRGENKNNCICTDTTNKFSTIGTCVRDGVCEGKTAGNLDGKQTNLTDPKNTPWSAYSGAGIGSSVGEWGVFGSDPAFNDSSGFDEGNNPALDSDPGESWEPPEQKDPSGQPVNSDPNSPTRGLGELAKEPPTNPSPAQEQGTPPNADTGVLSPNSSTENPNPTNPEDTQRPPENTFDANKDANKTDTETEKSSCSGWWCGVNDTLSKYDSFKDPVPAQDTTEPLRAESNGKVDPIKLYNAAREEFRAALEENGGSWPKATVDAFRKVGVTDVTDPDQLAKAAVMLAKTESGFRATLVSEYDAARGLDSRGLYQLNNQGGDARYGIERGDANNPQKSVEGLVEIAQQGQLSNYFGPIKRGGESVTANEGWFQASVAPYVQKTPDVWSGVSYASYTPPAELNNFGSYNTGFGESTPGYASLADSTPHPFEDANTWGSSNPTASNGFTLEPAPTPSNFTFAGTEQTGLTGGYTGPGFSSDVFSGQTPGAPGFAYAPSDSVFATAGSYLGTGEMLGTSPAATTLETAQGVVPSGQLSAETIPFDSRWANSGGQYEIGQRDLSSYNTANQYIQQQPGYAAPPTPAPGIDILAEPGYAAPSTPAPGIDIPTEPGYATPATPAPGLDIPVELGYIETNDVVGNAPVGRVEQGADLPPPSPSLWERATGALSGAWGDVREWWTGGDVLGGAPAGSVTSADLPDVPTNVPNIPAEPGYAAPSTPAPGIDIPTEPGYATPATPAPGLDIPVEPGYIETNDVVGNAPVGRVEQGADLPPIKQTWGEWANEKFTNIGDTLKGELGRWGRAYEILTSGTFGTQEPTAPMTDSVSTPPPDTMAIETSGASNPQGTSEVGTESQQTSGTGNASTPPEIVAPPSLDDTGGLGQQQPGGESSTDQKGTWANLKETASEFTKNASDWFKSVLVGRGEAELTVNSPEVEARGALSETVRGVISGESTPFPNTAGGVQVSGEVTQIPTTPTPGLNIPTETNLTLRPPGMDIPTETGTFVDWSKYTKAADLGDFSYIGQAQQPEVATSGDVPLPKPRPTEAPGAETTTPPPTTPPPTTPPPAAPPPNTPPPQTPPPSQQQPPAPPPTTPPPSGQSGNGFSGMLGGLSQMLGQMLGKLLGNNQQQQGTGQTTPTTPATTTTPTTPSMQAIASLIADPSRTTAGNSVRLVWASVGTIGCSMKDSAGAQISSGSSDGFIRTEALATTTAFTLSCVTSLGGSVSASTTVIVTPAATTTTATTTTSN